MDPWVLHSATVTSILAFPTNPPWNSSSSLNITMQTSRDEQIANPHSHSSLQPPPPSFATSHLVASWMRSLHSYTIKYQALMHYKTCLISVRPVLNSCHENSHWVWALSFHANTSTVLSVGSKPRSVKKRSIPCGPMRLGSPSCRSADFTSTTRRLHLLTG